MSNQVIPYQPAPHMMVPAHIPMADMERMALAIAKSGLFGVKEPNQALALMLLAQAEGMHPATAARDFHIINGRPSMKAETMMARFQQDGGTVEWHENSDSRASATFSHPANPKPVTIEWTLETAKKAELMGNKMWQKYPRAMLRSRVVSEGIRTVRPGVLMGMYTDEEVRSFTQEPEYLPANNPPAPPSRDLDAELAACQTVEDCRVWLASARQHLKLKAKDTAHQALIDAGKARAAEIEAAAQPQPTLEPETTDPELEPATDELEAA